MSAETEQASEAWQGQALVRYSKPASKNYVDANCGVEFGDGLGKMDKYGGNEEDMKQGRR